MAAETGGGRCGGGSWCSGRGGLVAFVFSETRELTMGKGEAMREF